MRGQRLRQRRHVVPLVSLQVVGLHAGEVAALIPAPDHVEVLIQAAGEEAGPPEDGRELGRRAVGCSSLKLILNSGMYVSVHAGLTSPA